MLQKSTCTSHSYRDLKLFSCVRLPCVTLLKLDFRCLHIHTDICSNFTIFIFCICLPCQTINDKYTSAGLCPLWLPNIILASTLRCAGVQSLHHRPCRNSFDKECVITEIYCLSPEEMSMVTRSEAQNRFCSSVFFLFFC